MINDRDGHWVESPLLPDAVPAPPLDRIVIYGAKLVRVYGEPGGKKPDGGREAVIVAWARMPDGRWAVLLAWAGHWMSEKGPHQSERARWGWYVLDPERVKPRTPPQVLYEGAMWTGWHEDSELSIAMREAAGTLPGDMQAAALKPAPDPED